MLPLHKIVQEIVQQTIPKLEQELLDTGKPVAHKTVHLAAMLSIQDAYYTMTTTLRDSPHEYETTAMEAAIMLAAASIKFVADQEPISTLYRVVNKVVHKAIPKLEQELIESGKPLVHKIVHPDAMLSIHDAYYSMKMALKEKPPDYETTVKEGATMLAGAAIKYVADLGDPRILKRLTPPDALVNAPEFDDDEKSYDEMSDKPWAPLKEMPRLGYADQERSNQVREARRKAEAEHEAKAKAQPAKQRSHTKMKPATTPTPPVIEETVPQEAPGTPETSADQEATTPPLEAEESSIPAPEKLPETVPAEVPAVAQAATSQPDPGVLVVTLAPETFTVPAAGPWSFTITDSAA